MQNSIRTVYGSLLQTCVLLKLPFSLVDNTTLNEKFAIQAGVAPSATELPAMRYFAIGNGGHKMSVGAGGIAKPEVIQHKGTDAALFNHLPFVLREEDNDLGPTDRALYGLRRVEVHNGKRYIAYYLKRLALTTVNAAMEYTAVQNGNSTVTAFVPDSSNLNPTPSVLNTSGVNVVSGDYVAATAKVEIALSSTDVDELLNVAKVIYDDDSYAIISEIALCSGVDKVVQSAGVGNTVINFNEVIAAQVISHVSAFFPVKYSNSGLSTLLDVGNSEALWSLQ